jgi:hypothetical protein
MRGLQSHISETAVVDKPAEADEQKPHSTKHPRFSPGYFVC